MSSQNILLIDDDHIVAKTAEKLINRCGYNVITAATGKEGIDLFKKSRQYIKCILLDLTMPEMTGWDVLKKIRTLESTIKIIVMSGMDKEEINNTLKNYSNTQFLQKPFTMQKLKKAIECKTFEQS
jgi:CheY-like chemotaxis protein